MTRRKQGPAPTAPPERASMRVEKIPFDKIVVGRQVRMFFGNIDDLAAKIDSSQWVDPLVVQPTKEGYRLICGERRYKAISKLRQIDRDEGIPPRYQFVDAQVYEGSELGAALLNTRENLGRKDLTSYELALQIHYLMSAHGMTQGDVARELAVSEPMISRYLQVLKLTPEIQEELKRGKIPSLQDMCQWARLRPEQQQKEFDRWRGIVANDESEGTKPRAKSTRPKMVPYKRAQQLLTALEAAKADRTTLGAVRYLMGLKSRPPIKLSEAPDESGTETPLHSETEELT